MEEKHNYTETITAMVAAIMSGAGLTWALIGQTIVLTAISATVSGVIGFYVAKFLKKKHG